MLQTAYFQSPFGCLEITASIRGIRSLRLSKNKTCPQVPIPKELRECVRQLDEYFYRKRKEFELALDFSGATPFYRTVWEELRKIPYGHTSTYSAIAEKTGDPKSVRAVGQANRNNPIAIIVPCHRCIAKSGELQGYFYGLDMKRKLLELENPMSFAEQGRLF